MSKRLGRPLVAALMVATIGVAGSWCRQAPESEPEPSTIGIQEEHEQRKAGLVLQFSDDFSKEYGPPDYFDLTRWTRLGTGQARIENGYWLLDVLRPHQLAVGGFATTERVFNPGLSGTNGVEITVAGFSHEGDHSEFRTFETEKAGQLRLVQAWSLTIGNRQGPTGGKADEEKDRGVQLHFDLILPSGLYVYLVRDLVPGDFDNYPRDGYVPGGPTDLSERERRQLHEDAVEQGGAFVTFDCVALASRVYRSEQEINQILGSSRRWGLYLTDDANTVYWTLDGQVMDTSDVSGYFSSSPESVRDGAFLSVMGVGLFERNTWEMDDLEIYVSP